VVIEFLLKIIRRGIPARIAAMAEAIICSGDMSTGPRRPSLAKGTAKPENRIHDKIPGLNL
jgi:hypothetical protein